MYRSVVIALAAAGALAASVTACSRGEARASATAVQRATLSGRPVPPPATPETTGRTVAAPAPATALLPANRLGRIPVLEYHLVGNHDALYSRTRAHFLADLEDAYRRGYRPITISQLVDRDFRDVPAGMSPMAVVFDDASPQQFRYIERNGQLEIDPTSAVGIWLDFEKSHPGWKNRATFCLLNGAAAGHNFFGDNPKFQGQQNAWRFRKVRWLAANGFELCDHTVWHAMLNKYSDNVVQEQIARNAMAIDSAVPGYRIRTMALPYGLWPKNRQLAWQGAWTDPKTGVRHTYHFDAVLEVAGGPTRSPYDPKFDPHHITRIQAVDDDIRKTLDVLDRTHTRFVVGR